MSTCLMCSGHSLRSPCPCCFEPDEADYKLEADENLIDVLVDDVIIGTLTDEQVDEFFADLDLRVMPEHEGEREVLQPGGKVWCWLLRQHSDSMGDFERI